jgi:hypothetical protein
MLQRVVTPALSTGYLSHGLDQVRGYVLAAADVSWATTPEQLFQVHGLGFPGSPFTPTQEYMDVLRFPVTPFTQLVKATGGTEPSENATLMGPFIDHPPFTGNGFAPTGAWSSEHPPTPVWWLDSTRLPAGSGLWRVYANGTEAPLGAFDTVAQGWRSSTGPAASTVATSDVLGVFGTWSGQKCLIDLVGDGYAIVATYTDIPNAGLEQGPRGLFWRQVPAGEVQSVHELRVTCRLAGVPFLLMSRWLEEGVMVGRVMYLGRNSREAEAMRLMKTDAGVYETTVPLDQLQAIQAKEFVQA